MKLCTMSPHTTVRTILESRPKLLTAVFTCLTLLAQAGTVAAGGSCGVITGP